MRSIGGSRSTTTRQGSSPSLRARAAASPMAWGGSEGASVKKQPCREAYVARVGNAVRVAVAAAREEEAAAAATATVAAAAAMVAVAVVAAVAAVAAVAV